MGSFFHFAPAPPAWLLSRQKKRCSPTNGPRARLTQKSAPASELFLFSTENPLKKNFAATDFS
jgi:hypothetical protein